MSTDSTRTTRGQLDVHALLSAGLAPAIAGAFSGAAIALGAGALSPPSAGAATYNGATTSYYVTTAGHTTLSAAGCYQGGVSGVADVVLDFGAQVRESVKVAEREVGHRAAEHAGWRTGV